MDEAIKIAIIVGSVRAGRFGPTVVNWFAAQTRQRADVLVDVVDIADHPVPENLHGHADADVTARLEAALPRLDAADAFVVVTPEYNHSFPGALKNFIDWHYYQWQAKPVSFISYGGLAGGVRATEHLRAVFAELHAVTLRETVTFHNASERFDSDGQPLDATGCNAAAKVLLDQAVWFGRALRDARARSPYRSGAE